MSPFAGGRKIRIPVRFPAHRLCTVIITRSAVPVQLSAARREKYPLPKVDRTLSGRIIGYINCGGIFPPFSLTEVYTCFLK